MKFIRSIYIWTIWNLFSRPFSHIYVKFLYRYFINSGYKGFPKPPFVIISNHGTFFDPWMIGGYSRYPFSFMVNDDGFREKNLSSWYLKSIDSIPKKKGSSDFKAMKATLSHLNNKKAVCIFPEGQTSWDGETQLLYKGIEKIIKKVNCALVMVNIKGNFLTKPWWAKTIRKGKIRLDFKTLSPEEIEELSSEQLFDIIKSYIYHNDIKDPDNQKYSFSGKKMAEGLERFVWICMHCGSEDTLTTNDNTVCCSSCNGKWDIDAYCRIKPHDSSYKSLSDLKDWSDMHSETVQKHLSQKDNELTSNSNVLLQTENNEHRFEDREFGTLRLTRTTLYFNTPIGSREWPIDEIDDYVVQKKDIFEFKHKNSYFRFKFDKKSPMKWVYYFRYLKNHLDFEKRGYY